MPHRPELSRRDFLQIASTGGLTAAVSALSPKIGRAAEAVVWSIVVPKAASGTFVFAARELQKYLTKIGAVQFTIVDSSTPVTGPRILLANSSSPGSQIQNMISPERLPKTGSDEFHLKGNGEGLAIIGGSDRAVLYGVYHLLESYGCRWFGPLEESVPSLPALSIPVIDTSSAPSLIWRGLQLISGSNPAVVDWMSKARLNVAWPEKYAPNPDLTSSAIQLKASAVPEMIERGMTIFWGGHILPVLFSQQRYSDHPEYFAQVRGKRLDPTLEDVQARWQLCTSNPDVIRILIENTITLLKNHPWIEVLFLWANDTMTWCECDECRLIEPQPDQTATYGGLNRSASYCRLIKHVHDGVQNALPGRRLAFNHYYNVEDLPEDLTLLPARTALSAVDVYQQCSRHPMNDPNCPKGKRIEPLIKAWIPQYDNTISWTYYWAWNFMKGLPFARTGKIARDLQLLKSLGVRGNVDNVTLTPAQMELYDDRPGLFVTEHWRYNLLDFHIYAKASWDTDLDVKATVADFIQNYYGPAARPMSRFWQRLESMIIHFDQTPEFAFEDRRSNMPFDVHGWLKNIRNLIPNRRNWEELEKDLREARHLAARAYQQPFSARYMPYVERIQLLERAIDVWENTAIEATYPSN